jgi:hypothetical protein
MIRQYDDRHLKAPEGAKIQRRLSGVRRDRIELKIAE